MPSGYSVMSLGSLAQWNRRRIFDCVQIQSVVACQEKPLLCLLFLNNTFICFSCLLQNPTPDLGEPERMYKLVLAGDAAVGKSSFILRLCKDRFFPSLNSTLGKNELCYLFYFPLFQKMLTTRELH